MNENLIPLKGEEVAVQSKGRLAVPSLQFLNKNYQTRFGIAAEPFDQSRELFDRWADMTVTGWSNGDLFRAVALGYAQYGIGGKEKLYENILKLQAEEDDRIIPIRPIMDLGFAACDIVYAASTENPNRIVDRVATDYPYLAREYVVNFLNGADIDVEAWSGGVESITRRQDIPALVTARATGRALTQNGWTPRERILDSEAVLFTTADEWPEVPFLPPGSLPDENSAAELEPKETEEPALDVQGYLASLGNIVARSAALEESTTDRRSYTQKALRSVDVQIKGLSEGSAEVIREVCRPDFDLSRLKRGLADLVFKAELIATAKGLSFVEVLNELAFRNSPNERAKRIKKREYQERTAGPWRQGGIH